MADKALDKALHPKTLVPCVCACAMRRHQHRSGLPTDHHRVPSHPATAAGGVLVRPRRHAPAAAAGPARQGERLGLLLGVRGRACIACCALARWVTKRWSHSVHVSLCVHALHRYCFLRVGWVVDKPILLLLLVLVLTVCKRRGARSVSNRDFFDARTIPCQYARLGCLQVTSLRIAQFDRNAPFVEVANSDKDSAVDVSGWQLQGGGVAFSLAPGAHSCGRHSMRMYMHTFKHAIHARAHKGMDTLLWHIHNSGPHHLHSLYLHACLAPARTARRQRGAASRQPVRLIGCSGL